jgi:hypothetical protein
MLELWNNWYETLASMEALATVIVVVVVAAGVITLAESRRRYADRDAGSRLTFGCIRTRSGEPRLTVS